MRLLFTPRAEKELGQIHDYIAKENPGAAAVRTAILAKAQMAARRPFLGVRTGESDQLRSILVERYQYRIHYALSGDDLIVLHIRHTARQPWSPEAASDD
jgi:toxin ParE1/3/4